MNKFRVFIIILFSILDAFCIYSTIGYTLLGLEAPYLVGPKTTYFTGMFIMALSFLLGTIVCSVIIIIAAVKIRKTRKNK